MRKRIAILGASGSIGRSAIDVILSAKDRFELKLISVHTNVEFAEKVLVKFPECRNVVVTGKVTSRLHDDKFIFGTESLLDLLHKYSIDVVLFAIPSGKVVSLFLEILNMGFCVAMANKECLVMAKDIISPAIEKNVIPVDSEQVALWQLLPQQKDLVDRIFLPCSGGPFFGKRRDELKGVSLQEAISHPRWNMGRKVSLDSATLMNKALEMIETVSLFGIDISKIEVVVHPQAILHGGVYLIDGSVFFHAGIPDMRIPIQYALSYPDRIAICDSALKLNIMDIGRLEFFQVDNDTFPSIRLAYKVMDMGGSAVVVFNMANDILGEMFLEGKIGFLDIVDTIERIIEEHKPWEITDIVAIEEAMKWTQNWIKNFYS